MNMHIAESTFSARLAWVRARRRQRLATERGWRADVLPTGPLRLHPGLRTAAQLMAESAAGSGMD